MLFAQLQGNNNNNNSGSDLLSSMQNMTMGATSGGGGTGECVGLFCDCVLCALNICIVKFCDLVCNMQWLSFINKCHVSSYLCIILLIKLTINLSPFLKLGHMSRANTADNRAGQSQSQGGQGQGLNGVGDDIQLSAHDEAVRIERERNQKEEDDFLKMENAFMTELSANGEQK
jgi:hypothetical protein